MQIITLGLLISRYSLFHPIHISITNISYFEDPNHFEVSVRLFRDDLEMIINHKYEQDITLTDDSISNEEVVAVNKYINEMLLFVVNNDTIPVRNVNIKIDDLMLVANFNVKFSNELNSLEVTNILMMDAFMDQKNLLIINYKNKEKGYNFTIDDYHQKIVL